MTPWAFAATSGEGCLRSGTMTTRMPAACAAFAPFSLSSKAMQSAGATPRRAAASRYSAGSGLPRGTSSPPATARKKRSTSTCPRRWRISSTREDEATAAGSRRPAAEVYRELRAAAASGWDFSARWCDRDGDLSSIRTTALLPVDLNSLLYEAERQLALLSRQAGNTDDAEAFAARAAARQKAMQRWLWNEAEGAFFDYDFVRARASERLTGATVTPLFVGAVDAMQAARVATTVRSRLVAQGGFGTSEIRSGQQWDRPNGWAPLQWLAIKGLARYGERQLAGDIAHRWLDTVGSLYHRESKLVEKYVVMAQHDGAVGGGGGEYPLQDGFGWTNGVTRRLLREDPANEANTAKAASRN